MQLIAKAYHEWWRAVAPSNPSQVQTEESRRAFYSGAFSMFALAMKLTQQPDAKAESDLAGIEHELTAYFRTINPQS